MVSGENFQIVKENYYSMALHGNYTYLGLYCNEMVVTNIQIFPFNIQRKEQEVREVSQRKHTGSYHSALTPRSSFLALKNDVYTLY